MIDYALHFFGGLILFVVFWAWWLNVDSYKFYNRSFVSMFYSAVLWEAAQLDVWWHALNYRWDVLVKYNWINNGLDIIAACAGALLAWMIMEMFRKMLWNLQSRKLH